VGEREGVEWVVREGVGTGGEMNQALYAHMNNKTIKKIILLPTIKIQGFKKKKRISAPEMSQHSYSHLIFDKRDHSNKWS
jgi:hypothetical protein